MGFVQVVLTDDHIDMLAAAIGDVAISPSDEPELFSEYQTLEAFLDRVAAHPEAFPVTGRMAKSIKHRMRLIKGPSQPPSRRSKRKARQERRMRTAKARRQERREFVEQYNAAREALEAERLEAEEAYQEQRQRMRELVSQETFTADDLRELGFQLDVARAQLEDS